MKQIPHHTTWIAASHSAVPILVGLLSACATVSAGQTPSPSTTLPSELVGVWSEDSDDGRAQCARYRALPAHMSESDEAWISLIGSLVIQPRMLHAFSEYGEGNFYALKHIERVAAGSWHVQVQVGIDALPSSDMKLDTETYRLALQNERLSWEPLQSDQRPASRHFKCGDLRRDVFLTE